MKMTEIYQDFFTLNNGNQIPSVGVIGTGSKWFKTEENDETFSHELVEKILEALELPGIVHIDAAEIYRTYPEVGKAIATSSKPREEIWITDKFSTFAKISENPRAGLEVALQKMNVEYVDLLLLHSPIIDRAGYNFDIVQAWEYLEELYKEGKAKNIGVSNFRVEDLELLASRCKIKPQVNQIEFHPFLLNQTPGIYDYCQEKDILIEAYGPLVPLTVKSEVDKNGDDPFYKLISTLTEDYEKTESQVLLRWAIQRNVLPVTTSSQFQRIKDAHYLFDPEITFSDDEEAELLELGKKHKPYRKYWKKELAQYDNESQI